MSICFLIANQRSGTSALGSIFNQHPRLRYFFEIFHDGHIGHDMNYFTFYLEKVRQDLRNSLPDANLKIFQEYLEYIRSRSHDRIAIIDVKYNSTHHINNFWQNPGGTPGFIRFLYKNDIPVIHLKRNNILKGLISSQIANLNKVWHTHDVDAIRVHSFRLDPQNLIAHLTEAAEQTSLIENSLVRARHRLNLTYESLFDADGAISAYARQSICGLLGLETFPPFKPVHVKQTKDNLRQVLENYSEVEQCLAGSPFAWMLEA